MKYLIYALTDPRTKEIRYIGQSTTGLLRPRAHTSPTKLARTSTHQVNWIKGLVAAGLKYTITVLEHLAGIDGLDAAEIRWIAYGRECGWPLTNITAGGNVGARGRKLTPDQITRLIARNTGRVFSPETRAKMSAARKGKKSSPEAIEKTRLANTGKKRTPEQCARISASLMGKTYQGKLLGDEHRAKLNAGRDAGHARRRAEKEARQPSLW